MTHSLAGSSVVLVAHRFNPSITTPLWLVRNEVLSEGDFLPGCVYTDLLVQVMARSFHLLLTPEQLQFVPQVPEAEQEALILDKVGRIVRTLPHTPFRALGLNFDWNVTPADGDTGGLARRLFFKSGAPLFSDFDVPDARFGSYLSKDTLGFRLKLDVKPVTVEGGTERKERLQFRFNYHADLRGSKEVVQTIDERLRKWREARAASQRIIEALDKGTAP